MSETTSLECPSAPAAPSPPRDPTAALDELQKRYADLAHEHQLVTIRLVHRTMLVQCAARMLAASEYEPLWHELEELLAGLVGIPRFWVRGRSGSRRVAYTSRGARALAAAPDLARVDAMLDERRQDPERGGYVVVEESDEHELALLEFPAHRGGLAFFERKGRLRQLWRTERELLEAVRAFLPSALDALGARRHLAEAALRDPLTEVYNRRALMPRVEEELARQERTRTPLALVMCDVDRFKAVNDEHGHLAGDFVLKEIARRLVDGVRRPDVVGRYGGEEFLLLLVDCPPAEACLVAERLRAAVSTSPVEGPSPTPPLRVTASFGVAARLAGDPAEDAAALVARADAALYAAKRRGRDRVEQAPVL